MSLFENYEPETNTGEKIKLSDEGDYFEGTVVRVSDAYDGDFGPYYFVNVDVKLGEGDGVPVGEEAGFPISLEKQQSVADVKAGKAPRPGHIHEELQRALKRVGKTQLDEGDYIGVKIVEIREPSKPGYKPFRKHAVIVQPAEPVSVFEKNGSAPF